tara:strand:- start:3564 stop:3785 length:222 start_codon:yes stop_codon:yes gene_type:complete
MKWYQHLNGETVGFLVTIMFVLASISASYGVSQHQLNKHDKDIETIKMDVDRNEDILIEIKNDVKWLRKKFES